MCILSKNWGKYSEFRASRWTVSTVSKVKHAVPFCPSGPSDVHVHWLVNGHSLATPVTEHRQPVGASRVLVSSWLREGPLVKDARYGCVAQAEAGSDASEVDIRLTVGGTRTRCDGGCVVRVLCAFWHFRSKETINRCRIPESCRCLADEQSIPSRDLNQWRGALTEYEQMLKRWQQAWVGLCSCMRVCLVTKKYKGLLCSWPAPVWTCASRQRWATFFTALANNSNTNLKWGWLLCHKPFLPASKCFYVAVFRVTLCFCFSNHFRL